jgi:hypothetical protein
MPYTYSNDPKTIRRRRLRRFWTRITESAKRRAVPALFSTLLFSAGLAIVFRGQSQDLMIGIGISSLGFAVLLGFLFLEPSREFASDGAPGVSESSSGQMLDQIEKAIVKLHKNLTENEAMLRSSLEEPEAGTSGAAENGRGD